MKSSIAIKDIFDTSKKHFLNHNIRLPIIKYNNYSSPTFKFRMRFENAVTSKTILNETTPPNKTAFCNPKNLAARPDSKSPISFDDFMKIELTADTLPLIVSGVKSCKIVALITTLTLSNIPDNTSKDIESQK